MSDINHMWVDVAFFGAVADAAGSREIVVEVPDTSTVTDVLSRLSPQLQKYRGKKLLHAVNEEYVDENAPLHDGDKLAVFAPVSGG
jgi:molybdopterin converting factor small subunit